MPNWRIDVYFDVKRKVHCMVALMLPRMGGELTSTPRVTDAEPAKLASPPYRAEMEWTPGSL
jgi:hypothetical protein